MFLDDFKSSFKDLFGYHFVLKRFPVIQSQVLNYKQQLINEISIIYVMQKIRLNDHSDFPSGLKSERTYKCISKLDYILKSF